MVLAAPDADASDPLGLVPWDWGHHACFGELNPLYIIDGPRVHTLPRIMARTLQPATQTHRRAGK